MKRTNLTDDEKMEALARFERQAVDEYIVFGHGPTFGAAIFKMESKMKQHGITPDRFMQYKQSRKPQ